MKRPTILLVAAVATGCATATPTLPDYSAFSASNPGSILILPPVNNSVEVSATHQLLSVVSRPVAERGYYVFPVAVVEHYFTSQGLPDPAEIHQIPVDKLHSTFGTDAVLYLEIDDWGSKYHLVASSTSVMVRARLVDARTGIEIWQGEIRETEVDGGSGDNIGAILATAAASQIINTTSERATDLARNAAWRMAQGPGGLMHGPLTPGFNGVRPED